MAHDNGWDILGREHFTLKSDVLEAEEMGKGKNLSKFDKGQIDMSKRLGPSISINCSSCGMLLVCSGQYQKWPKEETVGNQQRVRGG